MNLKSIPLFATCNKTTLNTLHAQMMIHHYRKGDIIHLEEEACTSLELILSGSVSISYNSIEGNLYTVKVLEKGTYISPNNLYSTNNHYFVYVEAVQHTEILSVPKSAIDTALNDPHFRKSFLQLLSDTARTMGSKLVFERQMKLRDKIIYYLKHQSHLQNTTKIILPVSKTALSNSFGVARTSLSRELQRMRQDDIIEINGKYIEMK